MVNRGIIFVGICGILAATSLAFPSIEKEVDINKLANALVAVGEDGNPEFLVMGDDAGRADLSKITNLLNFTAYLEGRPENQTAITFVPLITILASLTG